MARRYVSMPYQCEIGILFGLFEFEALLTIISPESITLPMDLVLKGRKTRSTLNFANDTAVQVHDIRIGLIYSGCVHVMGFSVAL